MKRNTRLAWTFVVPVWLMAGCGADSGGGGGSSSRTLLAVTGRTIPQGSALAFTFEAQADKRVNITVQADSNFSEPDFQVVIGEVDFQDLETLPISELVIPSADDRDRGQARDSFEPGSEGAFTIFITDDLERDDTRYSVTITQ